MFYGFANRLCLNYYLFSFKDLIEQFHYIIPVHQEYTPFSWFSAARDYYMFWLSAVNGAVLLCTADATMTKIPWGALSLLAKHADSLIQWAHNTITAKYIEPTTSGKDKWEYIYDSSSWIYHHSDSMGRV